MEKIGTIAISVMATFCVLGCWNNQGIEKRRSIDDEDSKIVVLANDWRALAEEDPKLIFCAWKDGYIVWSQDQTAGGAPYRCAKVDSKAIESLMIGFKQNGLFNIPSLGDEVLGPDSEFITIDLRFSDENKLRMASWHELQEKDGKSVVLDSGVSDVGNKTIIELLQKEQSKYLHFRLTWAELRAKINALIPYDSHTAFGSIVTDTEQKRSWAETDSKGKRIIK